MLACVAAVAYLVYFMFGPVYTRCSAASISTSQPSGTFGPSSCESMGWLQMTLSDPAPVHDFGPLRFFALWTLAPFVALIGTRLPSQGAAISLIVLAVLAEMSSIISIGGGFMYALLCGPLLLIALVATATSRMG